MMSESHAGGCSPAGRGEAAKQHGSKI